MEKSVLYVIVAVLATGGPPLLAAAIPQGTVVGWGDNNYGQSIPPFKITNAIAIAAGQNHSIAVRQDGTVVAWGYNGCGQTNVPPGLSNVVAVAAGNHSLALRADGSIVEWGNCTCCPMPSNISSVVSIAAGTSHSLALRNDGTIVGWGVTNDGRLAIPPGLSNVTAIAGGDYHSLALKADGSVVGWGSINDRPIVIPPSITGIAALTAGNDYSLGLRSNGTVVAWGDDPSPVPSGLSNVIAISARRVNNVAPAVTAWLWVGTGHHRPFGHTMQLRCLPEIFTVWRFNLRATTRLYSSMTNLFSAALSQTQIQPSWSCEQSFPEVQSFIRWIGLIQHFTLERLSCAELSRFVPQPTAQISWSHRRWSLLRSPSFRPIRSRFLIRAEAAHGRTFRQGAVS